MFVYCSIVIVFFSLSLFCFIHLCTLTYTFSFVFFNFLFSHNNLLKYHVIAEPHDNIWTYWTTTPLQLHVKKKNPKKSLSFQKIFFWLDKSMSKSYHILIWDMANLVSIFVSTFGSSGKSTTARLLNNNY